MIATNDCDQRLRPMIATYPNFIGEAFNSHASTIYHWDQLQHKRDRRSIQHVGSRTRKVFSSKEQACLLFSLEQTSNTS
jgi:hypothetical protein